MDPRLCRVIYVTTGSIYNVTPMPMQLPADSMSITIKSISFALDVIQIPLATVERVDNLRLLLVPQMASTYLQHPS